VDVTTDLPSINDIYNTAWLEPSTLERVQEYESRITPGRIRLYLAAVDAQGALVGYTDTWHNPWMRDGEFQVEVIVATGARGQGIGSQLYDAANRFTQQHDATRRIVMLPAHDPASLAFAERRGFTIERHIFESRLDLADFDERPFIGALERARADGVRFFSMADLGDSEEAQRRLHEVNRRASLDTPGQHHTFAPFEEWRRFVCEASWYRADGQIVAAVGDAEDPLALDWIGMAAVGYMAETNSMYHMITGVDRPYRGRGLATALKLLAIRCARRHNAVYLRTNNDSENAPMLAINRKLGFQPLPGYYIVAKEGDAQAH